MPRFHPLALILSALLLLGAIVGCAGAPVQEMSNARQAVQAAERAGATTHAPAELEEARRLLEQAKSNLDRGDYRAAREDAELSREKAMTARHIAETASAKTAP